VRTPLPRTTSAKPWSSLSVRSNQFCSAGIVDRDDGFVKQMCRSTEHVNSPKFSQFWLCLMFLSLVLFFSLLTVYQATVRIIARERCRV
jgi:hypothetical protein